MPWDNLTRKKFFSKTISSSMTFVSNHLRSPVYVPITRRLFEILLLSSRPTSRAQDVRILINAYSKSIAAHRNTTELIEHRQDIGFALFVQDMNSTSQSIGNNNAVLLCIFLSCMLRWRSVSIIFLTCEELPKSCPQSGSIL